MAAGPVGVKHPAKKWYILTALFSLIAWVLSLIAIFVPWSWKDTAVFERTYVGLWQNCVQHTNHPLNSYTCEDNDIDQVGSVAGGDEKCRGYFAATQVFTVSTVVFTFLVLVLSALTIGKLWSKPLVLGAYVAMLSLFAFGCALVAFLMWIVYAEQNCQPGNPLFALVGYSWGWILMVIATIFTLFAMVTAYLALFSVLKFKPFVPQEEPPMYPAVMEAPYYPPVMEVMPFPAGVVPMSTPILDPLAAFPPYAAGPVFGPTF